MRLQINRIAIVATIIVMQAFHSSRGEEDHVDKALYLDWATGRKQLIADQQAQEFEKVFRAPTFCAIPAVEDITLIVAELEVAGQPGVSRMFSVPKKYNEAIHDKLKNCKLDRRPIFEWPETGSLKIYSRNGNMSRVCWYTIPAKHGPLMVSIHGIRYVTLNLNDEADMSIAFTRLVERAYNDSK